MPIEHNAGSTTFTGDSIEFFQLCVQKSAVGLEMKGFSVAGGRKTWTKLREHYQIPGRGNRKATIKDVHAWLTARVEELRPLQQHIDKEG